MKANESVFLNLRRLNQDEKPAGAPLETSAEPASVSEMVIAAIDQTCRENDCHVRVPPGTPAEDGPRLLRLLAYSYAKGVLSAEEIERKCALAGEFPYVTGPVLKRFRRLNRPLVQSVLERTLRIIRTRGTLSAHSTLALTKISGAPSAPATILLTREAAARLDQATFIDGMSLD